jgi:hypothetical protein
MPGNPSLAADSLAYCIHLSTASLDCHMMYIASTHHLGVYGLLVVEEEDLDLRQMGPALIAQSRSDQGLGSLLITMKALIEAHNLL